MSTRSGRETQRLALVALGIAAAAMGLKGFLLSSNFMSAEAARCEACSLERAQFYAFCAQRALEQAAKQQRRRKVAIVGDNVISWAFIAFFVVLGVWQGYRDDAGYQWAMLIVAAILFAVWLMTKVVT